MTRGRRPPRLHLLPDDAVRELRVEDKVFKPSRQSRLRVKGNGLPRRMRLFVKFSASKEIIVYARLNGANTLRRQGGATDVHAVFRRILKAGNPPDSFEALMEQVSTGR
ncbi:MAG: type II toxin-antitoxin system YhaV family toxin [Rubrivivax sp.]|nr:type II toxin-antitoxin system YhaV family toxin [Rubrivivax sp.]